MKKEIVATWRIISLGVCFILFGLLILAGVQDNKEKSVVKDSVQTVSVKEQIKTVELQQKQLLDEYNRLEAVKQTLLQIAQDSIKVKIQK